MKIRVIPGQVRQVQWLRAKVDWARVVVQEVYFQALLILQCFYLAFVRVFQPGQSQTMEDFPRVPPPKNEVYQVSAEKIPQTDCLDLGKIRLRNENNPARHSVHRCLLENRYHQFHIHLHRTLLHRIPTRH